LVRHFHQREDHDPDRLKDGDDDDVALDDSVLSKVFGGL
jgi:hypothetical protein